MLRRLKDPSCRLSPTRGQASCWMPEQDADGGIGLQWRGTQAVGFLTVENEFRERAAGWPSAEGRHGWRSSSKVRFEAGCTCRNGDCRRGFASMWRSERVVQRLCALLGQAEIRAGVMQLSTLRDARPRPSPCRARAKGQGHSG